MAVDIPLVIQNEILCRLPIKSLIRFTSVSKQWKSFIHSSEFNFNFMVRQAHRKCLITAVDDVDVENVDVVDDNFRKQCLSGEERWPGCLIVDDDDTFPKRKVCLTYPRSLNQLKNTYLEFHGSSLGLLCFSANHIDEDDTFIRCVIWNPSIRKSIAIETPYYPNVKIAFGVCPKSLDPKIVKINMFDVPYGLSYDEQRRVWRVEVFTLNSRVWRSPFVKIPSKWFDINFYEQTPPLVINGFIYWLRYASIHYTDRNADGRSYMIISFDLATEEFMKIHVPDELAHSSFDIFKLGESVAISESSPRDCKVWLMDHVTKSFTELYSIKLPEPMTKLGCTDNNQLIIIDYPSGELVAYDPDSKHLINLGIYVDCFTASFTSYTESLLLLDQSNTLNDDEGL
ncbi:putative F-box protein At1g32420 [Rutidosis leptorrhynchoides]|uniref:putative F-box protein At1g32420 n=1 Tax=Rutidosis leptorrhynchoides TaxID=125765 RepID=UPI003A998440